MSVSSFWLRGSRVVYIIIHFFQSFSTRQNPCTQARRAEKPKAQEELDGFSLLLISLAGIRTKQILRQKSDSKQSVKYNRGRTLQACQNRKRFCPAEMTSLTLFDPLISMLTKDDWLLHLLIYSFRLFEFDWFLCRCSLATVIELQWSNIFFILAQESLLKVFVSTPKLGITIFQWGWRYMAVKKVCKCFITDLSSSFHETLPGNTMQGTLPNSGLWLLVTVRHYYKK